MNFEFTQVAYSFLFGERRTFFWTTVVCLALFYRLQNRRKSSKGGSANFAAFLRQDNTVKSATQFASFLRDPATEKWNEEAEITEEDQIRPENAICIPVFYGTEYGFAKEIAESLSTDLKTTGNYWPIMLNMADFPTGLDITSESVILMICSTQGDGVPPYEAREFCEWVFEGSMGDLSSTAFSICALGDKSYMHFCRCGMKLRSSLISSGAHEFTDSVQVDKEDWKVINKWKTAVITSLPSLNLTNKSTHDFSAQYSQTHHTKGAVWSKNRPYLAKLIDRWDLCTLNGEDDKRTMHLEVDISDSGLSFLPGDALGVYPKNCTVEVDTLLAALDASPEAEIPNPTWTSSFINPSKTISLKNALIHYYDLKNPRQALFELLFVSLKDDSEGILDRSQIHDSGASIHQLSQFSKQKESLLGQLVDCKEKREEYLEDRHIIDILHEFQTNKLQISKVLECLRPLQPRLYSISSSMMKNNTQLSITVAEVKYEAHGQNRKGVTSTWLSERIMIGDNLLVYISPNPDFRLPNDLKIPLIMIGPGTGLAPFRAFIQQRVHLAEAGNCGTNLLFFGCRRQEQDFLYRAELESWNKNGVLKLYTAFSREQDKKVYVQHKLWEAKEEIWKLISLGGQVYVCGDAKFMAPDVEQCLLKIFITQGDFSLEEAQQFFEKMKQTRQYQRDVWF
eukprot:g2498.t1